MSDEAVFEHLKHTAQHLNHEFREANKKALLNVVSGEGQPAWLNFFNLFLSQASKTALLNVVSGERGGASWMQRWFDGGCCSARSGGRLLASPNEPNWDDVWPPLPAASRTSFCCANPQSTPLCLPARLCRHDVRTRLLRHAQPAGTGRSRWVGGGLVGVDRPVICRQVQHPVGNWPAGSCHPVTPARRCCIMLSRAQVPQRQILFRTIGRVFTGLSDTSKAFLIILITGRWADGCSGCRLGVLLAAGVAGAPSAPWPPPAGTCAGPLCPRVLPSTSPCGPDLA